MKTIQAKGRLLDLSKPIVMGILNLTPDSFYDGGRWQQTGLLEQAAKMIEEGAGILDIGGMSSRPGSKPVTVTEELDRVIEPIRLISTHFPEVFISIDTWRAEVAEAAVEAGADIINDISGAAFDENLLSTIAALKVPYILMHIQGSPETMQENPNYKDILTEISDYFIQKLHLLNELGIKDVILDPGFGFGKTLTHNYQILAGLRAFTTLGRPILAGVSRKSMICKALGVNPNEALNGTTAANILALQQGAKILRVHDVKEAVEAIKIWNFYKKESLRTTFIAKMSSDR